MHEISIFHATCYLIMRHSCIAVHLEFCTLSQAH